MFTAPRGQGRPVWLQGWGGAWGGGGGVATEQDWAGEAWDLILPLGGGEPLEGSQQDSDRGPRLLRLT